MFLIAQFGLFNGVLVLLLIFVYSFRRSTNKIFLGLSLFSIWYSLLITQMNVTGMILEYPALQRTGIFAAYLAFPFLFIYSRNTFYPGRLWRGRDWLMMVPALLYVIDLMPFFVLSAEQKTSIWRDNLASHEKMYLVKEGWLGLSGLHFTFAYIWIAVIMYFQLRLIKRNWNLGSGFKSVHNRRLLYFILMISLLYLPLFLPGIFGVVFHLSWFNSPFIAFTYGLSLSAISIYLLIYPNILYGFLPESTFTYPNAQSTGKPEPAETLTAIEPTLESANQPAGRENLKLQNEAGKMPADNQEMPPELAIVIEHMKEKKPFLKQGFTIQDLSNQTGIPVYQLSPLINGYFKMNFANWVNRHRIEYFLQQEMENQNMTLEALSREAGFISRSTFINAFKKEKGVSPKEYIKGRKLMA